MKINEPRNDNLLMYIRSIASERELAYEEVLGIFEESLAQALRKISPEYREAEFRVVIDRQNGGYQAFRRWYVLGDDEMMEAPERQMILDSAREKSGEENLHPGDIIEEPMEADFSRRVSMLSAKQYLNSRLRDAERRRLMENLVEKKEILVSGQIMRIFRERGDALMEVMQVSCRLPKNEMIPREILKTGDRVQALIKEMVDDGRGKQIILTRTTADFLKQLFQRVVPEIEKGILEVVNAVRAPGNRSKIAVRSDDPRVDPVGTCVGIRGSRVQAVTNELNNERIDIVHWSEDAATYVLRALSPAEVIKVHIDHERRRMDVIVEEESMPQAVGKNGANVRLAKELTGWDLFLKTPREYKEETDEMTNEKSKNLAAALNLDIDVARILYEEGFDDIDQIAYAQSSDLTAIEGFEEDLVNDIQQRAKESAETRAAEMREKLEKMDGSLSEFEGMDAQLLYDLVMNDILTLSDFADLSVGELQDMSRLPEVRAGELIMRARKTTDNDEEEAGEARRVY